MNDTSNMSQKEILHSLPSTEILDFLENITDEELLALEYDLGFVGRPKQQIPPGDWANWLVLAGRGFGKTFVGAHFINTYARNNPGAVMCIMGETANFRSAIECQYGMFAQRTKAHGRNIQYTGRIGLFTIWPPYGYSWVQIKVISS